MKIFKKKVDFFIKLKQSKSLKYIIFLVILLIIPTFVVLNANDYINIWKFGYKMETTGANSKQDIHVGNIHGTEISSECHAVTNSSGIKYFIPSKTKGEWDAFEAHAPDLVDIKPTCCTPDCDGKECGDDGCGGSCGSCPADSAWGPYRNPYCLYL